MEKRKGYIIMNKSGGTASKGGYTTRVTLPSAWVKELGLFDVDNKENRAVELEFNGEEIIIRKKVEVKEMKKDVLVGGYHYTILVEDVPNNVKKEKIIAVVEAEMIKVVGEKRNSILNLVYIANPKIYDEDMLDSYMKLDLDEKSVNEKEIDYRMNWKNKEIKNYR